MINLLVLAGFSLESPDCEPLSMLVLLVAWPILHSCRLLNWG